MSLEPGTRFGGYDIVAKLGEGGMGAVYRARDTSLKRQVAIKVLPQAMATDADRLMRFQREAEVLASLNHPNIATIYGVERTADTTALVMELVEGRDLSEVTVSSAAGAPGLRGDPVDEALPIARQIAEALEAAHEAGVIHRDLKPANIRVRDDGTVKVLEAGRCGFRTNRASCTDAGAST
jgi:serine/threonine protein kinase